MSTVLYSLEEVNQLVDQGEKLLLAGSKDLLSKVKKGTWIGGTIPYFMSDEGGVITQEKIFVTRLPPYIENITIQEFDETTIDQVYSKMPDNGAGLIIIPAFSAVHTKFALDAPNFDQFAIQPLIGWISGYHLSDENGKAYVINGETQKLRDDKAVVMYISLPEHKYAEIGIINLFHQGDGDTFQFDQTTFQVKTALINGKEENFAEYLLRNKVDTRFPLVADYYGVMVNVSFKEIDESQKTVEFYAPVFKGIEYKLAKPISNYVSMFLSLVPKEFGERIQFACNCILNFLYSELEGKNIGIYGPITFGEIAYQLLNQTLVYLLINDYEDEEEDEEEEAV